MWLGQTGSDPSVPATRKASIASAAPDQNDAMPEVDGVSIGKPVFGAGLHSSFTVSRVVRNVGIEVDLARALLEPCSSGHPRRWTESTHQTNGGLSLRLLLTL